MFYQLGSDTVAFSPIGWFNKQEDFWNAVHGETRNLSCLSKPKSLHHFDSSRKMVVGRKISHSSLHSLPWNNTLGPYYKKKSIQKCISSLTVFCFLKTSVFSFCFNTSAALSHFSLSLEPLSASPTKVHCCRVRVSRSAEEAITLNYKQSRCFLLLDLILYGNSRECKEINETVRVHLSVCDQSQLAEGRLCVRENWLHSLPQLGWPTRACRGSTRERIKINCRQHLILPF